LKRGEEMKVAKVIKPYSLQFEEQEIPVITDQQVLLKVNSFGICASDMQIYHGLHKFAAMPVVMGHEVSATIDKVGKDVTGYQVGDKVTIEPQVTCGVCNSCKTGRFNVCEDLKVIGVHIDGCNAEYFAINPEYLHHVPKELTDEMIALVEPLAVGVGSIKRSQKFKNGNVVVVGAGTIGNFVAQAAKGLGAAKVMVTDINQDKLDYALKCGIDYAIDTSKITLKEAVEQCFGERKADVIVDCVAVPDVFKSIIDATRPNSDVILTGNYKKPVELEIPKIQRREVNLIGHMMYVREDFEDAIQLLADGKITISKTVSQVYNFEEYREALEFAEQNPLKVMKIIVKM
jgi:L-iditol 2-dehydrogenase